MSTDENEPKRVLDHAAEAVRDAAETVQVTTESIASAIGESRQHGGLLDQLSRFTREAPLRSLTIAFVAGLIFARRR